MYLADGAVRLRVRAVRDGRRRDRRRGRGRRRVASRQGLNVPGPLERSSPCPRRISSTSPPARRSASTWSRCRSCAAPQDIAARARAHAPAADREDREAAGRRARRGDHPRRRLRDGRARRPRHRAARSSRADRAEEPPDRCAGSLARPSITATQMLDSMVASTRPTRAEVADVANAILDGTDAVMLSQETAIGHYPVESIAMMASIAEATEPSAAYQRLEREPRAPRHARPVVHGRLRRLPRRARARARRARHPDAVGPLGATGLRAPPDGADLCAVARARDRAPLRAHVGRAGRVDPPPRGHRGAHQRLRPARRRARLAAAGLARRDHGGAAERAPGSTSLLQIQQL